MNLSSRRSDLISCPPHWVIKGLVTDSIVEPAVQLKSAAKKKKYQALEIYEYCREGGTYPLTAVDIIANSYFRLSHQKTDGKSATLASSAVGTFSFRTADNHLSFVPRVSSAELKVGKMDRPEVHIEAEFTDNARLLSVRKYNQPLINLSSCDVSVTFQALKDIRLSEHAIGRDAFRLCTISSMYTPHLYDANKLEYYDHSNKAKVLMLAELPRRARYLFPQACRFIGVINLTSVSPSSGIRGVPGSYDAPSIRIYTDSSLNLGLQGYLADSLDPNSDSLTIWVEWLDPPAVIPRDYMLSFSYRVEAHPCGCSLLI